LTILLFDLDGTLTDPRKGLVNCVRHAFEALNRPCPPEELLVTFIGPPLRPMFATLLDTSDTALIESAVAHYRERYARKGLFETEAYPGISEMLAESRGFASAAFLATSKPTVFAKRIVDHLGFKDHFSGIYGVELDGRFDDKADLLAYLLDSEGIAPESAVMIGDRAADILAARANRIRTVGVLWGYGSWDELNSAGARTIAASPRELTRCLGTINGSSNTGRN
jgi:phosphoglycolate phosphatase